MRLRTLTVLAAALLGAGLLAGCGKSEQKPQSQGDNTIKQAEAPKPPKPQAESYGARHLGDYAEVTLNADMSAYDAQQKQMIGLLIDAAKLMDPIYWRQAYGDKSDLMAMIGDQATRQFAEINYGPWDRLNGNRPFVKGVGEKPAGANFYPADMSREEFDKADLADKTGLYTLLRRDDKGNLTTVPYHEAYQGDLHQAAELLRQAADLAENSGFKKYLGMRADALESDKYFDSDMAWMSMKDNPIDIVIGPIETYEDQLFGYKAAYESYVLLKDQAWSKKLARFAQYLPKLQEGLPVPDKYKQEKPGSDADLNAYNVVYYAGNANAGAKTIAINLPNDEKVQLEKGTRRLQLENAMKAKFDKILVPIADQLIAEDQQKNITFPAFFQNTMFHEVAHGLGIKNTINGKGTVRKALKEYASSFEEGKADVLGLYMVTQLAEMGELDKSKLMDNYVTFLASIFRSVRFGASDAHAKANMVRFNFFKEHGAFSRDPETGRYRVDFDKMQDAMNALSARILKIQGDGDYASAKDMTDRMGVVGDTLGSDLKKLDKADIPVDVIFNQGKDVLGLSK